MFQRPAAFDRRGRRSAWGKGIVDIAVADIDTGAASRPIAAEGILVKIVDQCVQLIVNAHQALTPGTEHAARLEQATHFAEERWSGEPVQCLSYHDQLQAVIKQRLRMRFGDEPLHPRVILASYHLFKAGITGQHLPEMLPQWATGLPAAARNVQCPLV